MTTSDWEDSGNGTSLYAEMRARLENPPRKEWSIPTDYAGTEFRSRLEAGWASTLDRYGIEWEYEPETVQLPSGARYLPDFRLPKLNTVIEAKGPHGQRLEKTREYARANPGVVTLIGYTPAQRSLVPFRWESYMQWSDALGCSALFTQCEECGARQWCRPRFSMRCRACGTRFNGHLAACGEMPFTDWKEEERFEPLRVKSEGALNAMVPRR